MSDSKFDYRNIKFEIIELLKKNNLTFSQAYRVIGSIRRELDNKSLESLIK